MIDMKQTRIWNYSLLALFLLCQLAFFLNGERRIKREVERTVPFILAQELRARVADDGSTGFYATEEEIAIQEDKTVDIIEAALREKLGKNLVHSLMAFRLQNPYNEKSLPIVQGDVESMDEANLLPKSFATGDSNAPYLSVYLKVHWLDRVASMLNAWNGLVCLLLVILYIIGKKIQAKRKAVTAREEAVEEDVPSSPEVYALPENTVFRPAQRTLERDGVVVSLRGQVSILLKAFLDAPGRELTFEELEGLFWKEQEYNTNRRAKLVSELRKVLQEHTRLCVRNVYGTSYRLEEASGENVAP